MYLNKVDCVHMTHIRQCMMLYSESADGITPISSWKQAAKTVYNCLHCRYLYFECGGCVFICLFGRNLRDWGVEHTVYLLSAVSIISKH